MELVYLWVEEYKNIKRQGFNFSSRFNCEYDEEEKELKIIDKEEIGKAYPKNFFGENINITAIVGENGSGKSSILEILAEIFRIEFNKNKNLIVDDTHTFDFFLIFKIKDKTYEIKSMYGHDTNTFNDDNKIENILDYYIHSNDKNIEKQILFDNTSIAQMLVYDYSQNKNFKLSSFMYLPTKIEIRLCDFEVKFEKLISNDKLYPMYKNESDDIYIRNTSKVQQTQIESFENINNDKYFQFLILKLLENSEETHDFYLTKEKIQEKLKSQNIEYASENDFNSYFNISNEPFNRIKKEVDELSKEERRIYINKFSDFFEFDFIDELNRKYSDLSHGEKTLFGQLLNIYHNSQKSKNDNLLFLFDEPELSLHPQWQKNYINEIYSLIEKLGKNYQFNFTSHSPFILSDLPKENVIFLEKDEKTGDCINATDKMKDFNTFGANIHTLLSHGFFMKDGLMGEFAKSKINKTIEYLNQKVLTKEEIDYCENIISIIGEPLIKRQLQKMLDSKKYQGIESINKKIRDMEYELELLKKHQSREVQNELNDRAKKEYYKKKNDE
ncbi:AAA family ATPase [Malaciobacter sp. WC5094]